MRVAGQLRRLYTDNKKADEKTYIVITTCYSKPLALQIPLIRQCHYFNQQSIILLVTINSLNCTKHAKNTNNCG